MPKKPKPKPILPKTEDVKSAREVAAELAKKKERLAKLKVACTADGKLNKYDAKYRVALKEVKRLQRKLKSELVRHRLREAPKPAAAEGEAPAEAPKA